MNRDDRALLIEPLEARTFLSSVKIVGKGVLQIVGNQAAPNVISVGYSPHSRFVVVVLNGVGFDFKPTDVNGVRIFGGAQADRISVVEGRANFDKSVRAVCGAGNDTFIGGHERDVVFGDDGNDFISLGSNDDVAVGGNGNDRIIAGDDTKTIFGGAGDDVIAVGSGRGYLFGGDGNDAIATRGSHFVILGNAGDDQLTGRGRDTLWGGEGVDILTGGTESHPGEVSGVGRIIQQLMPSEPTLPTNA